MRISVVVPVLDGEAFLAQAIRSVLAQSRPADEVLVVDNGSADCSIAIAEGFGPPVRVLHEPRRSAAAARARGAAVATGEALMFLDADDLLGPTVLEELAAALEARPGTVACCPWRRYEKTGEAWVAAPASCAPRRRGEDALSGWLRGWYHPPCSVIWSREALAASGGWDAAITVDDDGDVMMRALAAGVPLVLAEGGTAYYRRAPDGDSLSGRRLTPAGLASRLAVLEKIEARLGGGGAHPRRRAALAEAFARVERDCAGRDTALEHRAREGRKRNRGGAASRLAGIFRSAAEPERRPPVAPRAHRPAAPDRRGPAGEYTPLVSVVIPTYNRARLTLRALDSALGQTYRHLEVLVVDDGSTDDTAEVVAGRRDPRVRYLRQPQNAGVAAARNRGMREARGSWIAFLDSDDAWTPLKLERQVELARRRPESVGLVYTGLVRQCDGGDRSTWTPEARGDVFAEMLHRNAVHLATSGTLVRRSAIEAVGGFDESWPANEDHDYWTRIARLFEFDFVAEPLMVYFDQGAHEEEPVERRSRNFEANMRARQLFLDRYGEEAREAGVKHLYHLDCARRHLELPPGRAGAARLHLAKALRDSPVEARLYAWLAFSMLPAPMRRRVAPALKAMRTRLPERLSSGPVRPRRRRVRGSSP